MNLKKILLSAFLILSFNFFFIGKVFALNDPSFPTCAAPIGTLKVYYANGNHGIPGDTATHSGSDWVYTYTDGQLVQCFCPPNGTGIQTNWWKIPDMSQDEIKKYLGVGWNYIADGSAWGLDNAPYLAKNYEISCAFGGRGGGEVLGIGGGEVLGLAATGNITQIIGSFAFGVFLLYCATKLREEE